MTTLALALACSTPGAGNSSQLTGSPLDGTGLNDDTGSETTDTAESSTSSADDDGYLLDLPPDDGEGTEGVVLPPPTLWYSAGQSLTRFEISPQDGTVLSTTTFELDPAGRQNVPYGQSGITMLVDGSLLLSRYNGGSSRIYHIPLTDEGADIQVAFYLGTVPDQIGVEALYSDCDGNVYLMDTGSDSVSSSGNRLLRFTGDFLSGDLSVEEITDLSASSVADMDDLAPGLTASGEISDGSGLALDSGKIFTIDYLSGTGTQVGNGGSFGIHVLGREFFDDESGRIYVMDASARLYMADPNDGFSLSDTLATGPGDVDSKHPGWSGLTGPLPSCETDFPPPG